MEFGRQPNGLWCREWKRGGNGWKGAIAVEAKMRFGEKGATSGRCLERNARGNRVEKVAGQFFEMVSMPAEGVWRFFDARGAG